MDPKERFRLLMEAGEDIHRCPNTGRIIDSPKHDDKVLCGCGKSSPGIRERGFQDAPGTHFKFCLPRATFEEWWAQKLKDDAEWEKEKHKDN